MGRLDLGGDRSELFQMKRELAVLNHNLSIVKASSESAALPLMGHKGHQKQVETNEKIKKVLVNQVRAELASLHPEGVPPSLLATIKKGEDLINRRNSIIHIADGYGWEIASEYEGNPFGLTDFDNKKLEEAEKRVAKKKEMKRKEAAAEKKGAEGSNATNRRRVEERKERSLSRENRYLKELK